MGLGEKKVVEAKFGDADVLDEGYFFLLNANSGRKGIKKLEVIGMLEPRGPKKVQVTSSACFGMEILTCFSMVVGLSDIFKSWVVFT